MAQRVTGWVGWIMFAGICLFVVGVWDIIVGIAAILGPDRGYLAYEGNLLVLNLSGWGWWHVTLGAVVVLVGIFVPLGHTWARFAAVVLVTLNLVTQFVLLVAQPWWSIAVIVVSVFALWALVVHGHEAEAA